MTREDLSARIEFVRALDDGSVALYGVCVTDKEAGTGLIATLHLPKEEWEKVLESDRRQYLEERILFYGIDALGLHEEIQL